MKKKRTIFIELTSLLDVILIMIFVLLMQARTQTAQAMDQAEQEKKAAQTISEELGRARTEFDAMQSKLENEIALLQEDARGLDQTISDLQQEAEGLRRQLSSRELVLENSLLLTLSTGEDGIIRLEQKDKPQALIPYDWSDDSYASNSLKSLLLTALNEAGDRAVFLVFQYDRTRIYKAEYDMILQLVAEAKSQARQAEIPFSYIEMDIQDP